jgi:hypothetical protein
MKLEPFKPKSISAQVWDAAWDYIAAVTSGSHQWIGYTRHNARRAAKHYPKEFAAGCREALACMGRNLRHENHC